MLERDIEIEVQNGVRMLMIPTVGIPTGRYHMTLVPIEPLKRCPFCGGEARTQYDDEGWWAVMCNCGATPFRRENEAAAIAAWNKRESPPPM